MRLVLFAAISIAVACVLPNLALAAVKGAPPQPAAEARIDYQRLDAKLNHAYAQLLARSPSAMRPMLVQAERNWSRFKDEDCRFQLAVSNPANAATASEMLNECLASYTRDRLQQIERQIECPGIEGDVTCRLK